MTICVVKVLISPAAEILLALIHHLTEWEQAFRNTDLSTFSSGYLSSSQSWFVMVLAGIQMGKLRPKRQCPIQILQGLQGALKLSLSDPSVVPHTDVSIVPKLGWKINFHLCITSEHSVRAPGAL